MNRLKLAGLLLAGGVIAAIVGTAKAHIAKSGMQYDYACCHSRDCEEIPIDGVENLGNRGIRFSFVSKNFGPINVVIPRDKVKPSTDGNYHGCFYRIGDDIIGRCAYEPANT